LHVQTDNDFSTHLDHERTLIEAAGTTDAFREGVAAFLEKRRPSFD
jgi:2-(1,2-epoxy-1,2-dihydrophenyl)acetyl-CoA isomerase